MCKLGRREKHTHPWTKMAPGTKNRYGRRKERKIYGTGAGGTPLRSAFRTGQVGSRPSMSFHCSALVVDYLPTIALNTGSSLENVAFKRSTLSRTPVPKTQKYASQTGYSLVHSGVTTSGRKKSQQFVLDLSRNSSSMLRSPPYPILVKEGNRRSSRKADI